MKKLKLKQLNLEQKDILSRDELKSIVGGDDGSGSATPCSVTCVTGYYSCCWWNILLSYCKCYQNGTKAPQSCDAGGVGSSACTAPSPH